MHFMYMTEFCCAAVMFAARMHSQIDVINFLINRVLIVTIV